jgi:hypothetical protein
MDAVPEGDVPKLLVPAPAYSEGKYENGRAMPSPTEQKLYALLAQRKPPPAIKQIIPTVQHAFLLTHFSSFVDFFLS